MGSLQSSWKAFNVGKFMFYGDARRCRWYVPCCNQNQKRYSQKNTLKQFYFRLQPRGVLSFVKVSGSGSVDGLEFETGCPRAGK